MRRGELYLIRKQGSIDPKKQRVFVVVSREYLVRSRYSTVICAPVYSRRQGLSTQVEVGTEQGLKHDSSVNCDELVTLSKTALTRYVGMLNAKQLEELNRALSIALGIEDLFL